MNRGNLRKRLERLECGRDIESNGVPVDFWDALAGTIPLEQMTPECRQWIEPLYGRDVNVDPLEEALRAAGLSEYAVQVDTDETSPGTESARTTTSVP